MDAKKMNLDAPFLSETKPEVSNGSKNTRKARDSFQETEHETLIRLLQDQSFNHVMEPPSVPCSSEETLGKPMEDHQHHTLIEELDILNGLEMVSSTSSFSGNCSSSGVSEFEKNGERSSNGSRDDVILEYRDLIMSRFLPAAEAIAMKQKKEASRLEEERKKKQSIALQRVSMAINQDLNNDDDEDDEQHNQGIHATVYSNDSKKPQLGLLPWSCSMNSLDVLNPVLSRVKTCQDLGVKSRNFVNRKPQDSVYKTKSTSPIILNSSKIMCNCQENYAIPRSSKEISKFSPSKSSEVIRIPRNPSRLQRKPSSTNQIQRQKTRFLAEEVKRRHNRNKNRLENLSVSQPPLPKTPSESWLVRTLPKCSAASSVVISGAAVGYKKKIGQKTNSQAINWETIVKTSYKHHDHVRYSKEVLVVRPSRQHKF